MYAEKNARKAADGSDSCFQLVLEALLPMGKLGGPGISGNANIKKSLDRIFNGNFFSYYKSINSSYCVLYLKPY